MAKSPSGGASKPAGGAKAAPAPAKGGKDAKGKGAKK
jgi:hypothetical protein